MHTLPWHVVNRVVVVLLLTVEVNTFDERNIVVGLRGAGHHNLFVVNEAVLMCLVIHRIRGQRVDMTLH